LSHRLAVAACLESMLALKGGRQSLNDGERASVYFDADAVPRLQAEHVERVSRERVDEHLARLERALELLARALLPDALSEPVERRLIGDVEWAIEYFVVLRFDLLRRTECARGDTFLLRRPGVGRRVERLEHVRVARRRIRRWRRGRCGRRRRRRRRASVRRRVERADAHALRA